jgi:hypothetical protein
MCLTINKNNLNPITAEQDIVCYKVLIKLSNSEILSAPIYNFVYCFGFIYSTHEDYFADIDVCDDGECLVEYGFHSFASLSDAVRFKWCLLKTTRHTFDYVVVKCTIPNGTRYYQGKQVFDKEHSLDGYCSESICIDDIVNENETQ